MFKSIAHFLGFDWIKNKTVRKVVRLAANIGVAAYAGANPSSAAILSTIGLTPGPESVAAAGTVLGAIEMFRNKIKHNGQ